jgi:hypothetical protein
VPEDEEFAKRTLGNVKRHKWSEFKAKYEAEAKAKSSQFKKA